MPTRVLVADDHLAIREGIRSLLAPDDDLLIVGEAADGVQASRMALELKPDLILLDNSMPGKTGLEVARELKPLLPNASIVFLTLDPGIRDLALAVGAVAHISKDTAPQETLRILRQVAQQRAKAKPADLRAIDRTLADTLVAEHLFTKDQMARLVATRGPRETLSAALIRTALIPDMRAAQVLSRVSGRPLVTLTPYHDTGVVRLARGRRSLIDPSEPTVVSQLARRLCEQRHVVLVAFGRSEATLAMADPLDEQTPGDVKALLGNVPVTVVTASVGEIAAAIARGFAATTAKVVPLGASAAPAQRQRTRRPLLLAAAVLAALLLFISGAAVVLGPAASAIQARANLTIFQGNVDVRPAGGAYAPAGTGFVVRQGDSVRTKIGANAALTFFDESVVVLEAGTELEIVELRALSNGAIAATLRQSTGSTWHVINHPAGTSARYAVTTPTSTTTATGTAFTVRGDATGATTVSTTEGSVDVRGVDAATSALISVTAGNMSVVASKGSGPTAASAFGQPTITFVLDDSRNAVVVDRTGRSTGVSDGTLVRYIPGSTFARTDSKIFVTTPNVDGDRFASVVSPLARGDQTVSVVAEAHSSTGAVVGQVADTRRVVDGAAVGGVRVSSTEVVVLSDDLTRALPAPITASVPSNTGFDLFALFRREPSSVAGNAGTAGPAGTPGPQGPPGPAGASDPAGPLGPQGVAGVNGATGSQGPAGANGVDGATGPAGANGTPGSAGAQGPVGPTGPAGPPGAARACGAGGA